MLDDLVIDFKAKQPLSRSVVRLKTSYWCTTKRGISQRKDITILKRKSHGYHVLLEDISNMDIDEIFSRIVNLDGCVDGVYEIVACNPQKDWETGYVDDYDYRLICYKDVTV